MRRFACLLLGCALPLLAQKKPFDVDALLAIRRASDPQLSPDGRTVAFTVASMEVATNKRVRQIYTVPLGGGSPAPLTQEGNNERARWSPDSRRIAFISDRSGSSQVWTMDASGANPRQITSLATEAGGVLFSPDGKTLVFTSEVYPDCPDAACNQRRLQAEKDSKVQARIYTALLYRHWTTWRGARRSHLFAVPVDGGSPIDLTPGDRDVPPFSLGGPDDYAISPDGAEVCYATNLDPVTAVSTNTDLFVVPITGGEPKKITINTGADASPAYSPDGRLLAFRSQFRAGYESDRWRLQVLERATGKLTNLTESLDRWVSSFAWAPDSTRLFFTYEDRGRQNISFIPATGGAIRTAVSGDSHLDDMQLTPDGRVMIYSEQSGARPAEIFRASSSGGIPTNLTQLNRALFEEYETQPYEEFTVEGAERAKVHGFLLRPPGFTASRRYPVLMLIHGGPQGAWSQSWSYRWNAQVFAGAGFLVVMPNPRGSTGYGQKFIDEINGDWGGRAYEDLMAVADHVAALPGADGARLAAAGASYGGYMVNWILGHTNRFKALVSHAGVFDLRSEAGETEELWFPIWEFGGMPWDAPDTYARWSPSHFVKEFKTPTLVVHGELDFRVPYGQGLHLFTALQMQKVPSKLLIFPDEGHWILKPQNSRLWYQTVIDWLDSWTKK